MTDEADGAGACGLDPKCNPLPEVVYGPADYATAVDGVKLEIVAEA